MFTLDMAQRVLDKLEADRVSALLNPDMDERGKELLYYERRIKTLLDDSDRVRKEVKPRKTSFNLFYIFTWCLQTLTTHGSICSRLKSSG